MTGEINPNPNPNLNRSSSSGSTMSRSSSNTVQLGEKPNFSVTQSTLAKGHFNFTPIEVTNDSLNCNSKDKFSMRYAPFGPEFHLLSNAKGVNLASVQFYNHSEVNTSICYKLELPTSSGIPWSYRSVEMSADYIDDRRLPILKVQDNEGVYSQFRWTIHHNENIKEDEPVFGLINLERPDVVIATYQLDSKVLPPRTSLLAFREAKTIKPTASELKYWKQEDLVLFTLFLSSILSNIDTSNLSETSHPKDLPVLSMHSSRTNSTSSQRSHYSPLSEQFELEGLQTPQLNSKKSAEALTTMMSIAMVANGGSDHLW